MNSAAAAASKTYSDKQDDYRNSLREFGRTTGLMGFVTEAKHGSDTIKKSAFQYLENHDHQRFICNFGTEPNIKCPEDCEQKFGEVLFIHGKRDIAYKVQPYLISLMAAKGIPFLFQGQEIGEDYFLPTDKIGRVAVLRAILWEHFYDEQGQYLIRLTRKLIKIRRSFSQLRHGDHYFYDEQKYLSNNVVVFSRSEGRNKFSVVAVNFNDYAIKVPFEFPYSGQYIEQIDGVQQPIATTTDKQSKDLSINPNYGVIWASIP
jgi:maltooligosyltrehalose trehalohydrolase